MSDTPTNIDVTPASTSTKSPSRLHTFIADLDSIGDHIFAIFIIIIGACISPIHVTHDVGLTLITTGAAMWRGKQPSPAS